MRFELISAPQGEVLKKYRESTSRVSFIMGPLGSGKTFESCIKLFYFMCSQKANNQGIRKTRFYAIRNTYSDLLSTTTKDWLELFGDLGRYKGGGIEPPHHKLHFRLKDKTIVQSELIFLALDKPMVVKKLRGSQATGFWLNEVKELDKAIVDMADLRHGRYPSAMDGGPSWHGMIGDTNAPDDDSWYYKLSEEVKPKNWVFFKQPGAVQKELALDSMGKLTWTGKWLFNDSAENLNNLPKDYYKQGLEGKAESWILVNLANEYGTVTDGRPIYKDQWRDAIHVSDKIKFDEEAPLVIGLDFGLTPAAVFGQMSLRGTLNTIDELVSEGMGIRQFIESIVKPHIARHYKKADLFWVGDPSGNRRMDTDENTVFKELLDLGIECEPANTNNPEIRWEAVRWFLEQMRDGKPAFQLHPRCGTLRRGFNGGYQLRRMQIVGQTKYSEKADKNKFSHDHDALQYLAMYFREGYMESDTPFNRPKTISRWGY